MIKQLAYILGFAGLVPFAFVALTLSLGLSYPRVIEDLLPQADITYVYHLYAALILSFLGGINWGQAVSHARDKKPNPLFGILLLWSVLPPLIGLYSLMLAMEDGLFLLLMGYVAQLGFDIMAYRRGASTPWFLRLRLILTLFVVLSLAVVIQG